MAIEFANLLLIIDISAQFNAMQQMEMFSVHFVWQ